MDFYKAIIDTSDDLISIFDQKGNSLFFSKAYESVVHTPISTLESKHFSSFLDKPDKLKIREACKGLNNDGAVVTVKHRVVLSDKATLHLKSTIRRSDDMFIVTSQNIQENEVNIKGIVNSENLWKSLSDSIPDFVTITDTEGVIIYVNQFSYGLSEKDVIGKRCLSHM